MLTQERLKEILHYDPETGDFTWLKHIGGSSKAGKIAGVKFKSYYLDNFYLAISIFNIQYQAHQLAFMYMEGYFPYHVDHEDGNGLNNKWNNLREATKSQNAMNSKMRKDNKTGIKGVSWEERETFTGYQARIVVEGKQYTKRFSLSKHDFNIDKALEAATKWIQKQRTILHGEFANHGI